MINKTLRRLAVGASAITVLGVVVPLAAATSASAAEATGITATPASQTAAAGSTATYTATLTPAGATSANGVFFQITGGPAAGVQTSGTACTAGVSNYSCVVTAPSTSGTYTVTIYDNTANVGSFQAQDPNTTVTLVSTGKATKVVLSPTASHIATATCQTYTITATDVNGNPAAGDNVPVTISQTVPTGSADPVLRFCTPNQPAPPKAAATTFPADNLVQATKTSSTATTDTYSVPNQPSDTFDSKGLAYFGVASDTPGTVTVQAGTSSSTFTASNATLTVDKGNTNASGSTANGDNAVSLTLSPTSQSAVAGATVTETAVVKNATSDLLGGVQISGQVTGTNAGATVTCGITDQTGTATCTYKAAKAGTDTFTGYVNQDKNVTNTAGPDTGEPQAKATLTVGAALNSPVLTNSCAGASSTGNTTNDGTCNAAASATSQTVTFTLTSTPTGGKAGTPAVGATVTFTPTDTTNAGGYAVSPTSGTTDANGQVTVTVTHTAGKVESGTLKATFDNGGTSVSDTTNVDFVAATATALTLTPQDQTKAVGSQVTVTATATNALKAGVAGDVITFQVSGRNNVANNTGATGSCTTAANGSCSFTYTDKGPAVTSNPAGPQDTVAAKDTTSGATDAANVTFVQGTATASKVTLTTSATTASVTADPAAGKTAPVTTLSAAVNDSTGNNLQNDTVTFTSSGVGEFTDATGHPTGSNSYTAQTDSSGVAKAYVRSTTAGTQTVTATADGVASNQVTVTYNNAQFSPVTPLRLVDTRTNQGGVHNGPLAPNTAYTFSLDNTSAPQGATAYVFNVTAVQPSGAGNLRIGPSTATLACTFGIGGGATPQVPTTSLINYTAGTDVANDVVVPNSSGCDDFTVYSAGSSANVVIDLQGYYAGGYSSVTPTRAVDTRSGQGGHSGTIAANTSASFTIAGVGGVPAVGSATPAKAVAINVTAIGPGGVGNLRVYPDGASVPTTSNINYIPGVDKAAFVVVELPANGKIDVYSAGSSANVAIDVFGYYPSTSTVVTQTPVRVFDSRNGTGLQAGTPVNVPVTTAAGATKGVPANATAVLISLTAIHAADSTGVGNLRVYPSGGSTPTVSNINYVSKDTDVANFAIVPIGPDGKITLYSAGSNIDAAVDILGYTTS